MKDDFLMKTTNDDWGILSLQNTILKIMRFIHKICVDNSINYYLMGGSALGAIRHNGFIPWDDDLDIFMTVEEYKKFKNAFSMNGNTNYYLQEWGKTNNSELITMAKVRDTSTTLIENAMEDWDINHGVYVDIFILHKAGNKKQIKKQLFWSRYLVAKGLSTKHYWTDSFFKNILLLALKCTPNRLLVKHALNVIYSCDNNDDFEQYFHFLGRAGLKHGLYPKSFFQKPSIHQFENIELYAPSDLVQYIIFRWGDNYMTPPSLEQIKHMQHSAYVNLDISYLEADRKINKRKNERKLIL